MKIAVVVATPNQRVEDFISSKKLAVIPADSRKAYSKSNFQLSVRSFLFASHAANGLDSFLSDTMQRAEGIVLVCDQTAISKTKPFSSSIFVCNFDGTLIRDSIQNSLSPIIARALRNFSAYAKRFLDQKHKTCLLLPLENFQAPELTNLATLFQDETLSPNFVNNLDGNLGRLRLRQTPKTNTAYQDRYLKDDRSHYFQYGLERHAQFETAIPPHSLYCEFNGRFRFGIKFDDRRHYNVSREADQISGEFIDCHGECQTLTVRPHLNMFPNGFF